VPFDGPLQEAGLQVGRISSESDLERCQESVETGDQSLGPEKSQRYQSRSIANGIDRQLTFWRRRALLEFPRIQ
jgi:hypothetical protein